MDNDTTYTSKGTIRVELDLTTGCRTKKLFFVPDHDYSIAHGKKTFAVFVSQSGNAIVMEYDRDKEEEIEIEAAHITPTDWANTKVEVQVKRTSSATEAAAKVDAERDAKEAVESAAKEAAKKADDAKEEKNETKAEIARQAAADAAEKAVAAWKRWKEAMKKAEEAMKDGAVELELTGITAPAK